MASFFASAALFAHGYSRQRAVIRDNGRTTDTVSTGFPLQREAMEDTLGLRLESRKDTRQGLVIDRVTMPTPD